MSEMRSIIQGESESHVILMSSHVLTEVERLCDRLLIMNQGKVSAYGTLEELTGRKNLPNSSYLEDYLISIAKIHDVRNEEKNENGVQKGNDSI